MYARGLGTGPVDESPFSTPPAGSQPMADFDVSNDQLMSILSARKYYAPATGNGPSRKPDCNTVQSLPLGFGVEGDNSAGLYGAGAEGLDCLINGSEQQSLFILEDQSTMSSIGNNKSQKRPAEGSSEGPKEVSSWVKTCSHRVQWLTVLHIEEKEADTRGTKSIPTA